MTEKEFLRSTPRKIGHLWEIHAQFNGWKVKDNKNKTADNKAYNMDDPEVSWFYRL